ncbi:MAG: hypothetical protein ABIG93_03000 [archaeon]
MSPYNKDEERSPELDALADEAMNCIALIDAGSVPRFCNRATELALEYMDTDFPDLPALNTAKTI